MEGTHSFSDIPKDRWEAAFGEWSPEKFREAKKKLDEKKRKKVKPENQSAAVHDDSLYVGYDSGLGKHIRGRTHRKEMMKQVARERGYSQVRECG